ncbi:ImmA/IrrE family metallo-endopeptidase [Bradyrhizobium sp. 14AA]
MVLRRGFKAEANWYATSLRKELDIAPHLPLCPWRLAEHLEFPVFPLSDYAKLAPEAVAYLRTGDGQKDFSAVTLAVGQERFIVHNDAHDRKRQAADISHELAHGLLLHPPMQIFDPSGTRNYDKTMEEEANWLGPALLVSDEAAMHIAALSLTISKASDMYGASEPLVRMRLNVTGAYQRVANRRRFARA